MVYIVIFFVLLACELLYFKIADICNIVDKPNERSSHSTVVLRGGGIIFLIGAWVWFIAQALRLFTPLTSEALNPLTFHPFFMLGLTLVAGVSFVDDIRSLPDSMRLVVQFVAMGLMLYQLGMFSADMWWMILPALIVCVGASNIINFMDGINGITVGYSGVVLVSILMADAQLGISIDRSMCYVMLLAVVVFAIFNFRPRGKAKCFAGDVGSVGMAIILLFMIGQIIVQTGDITWLIFLLVYGVDGCLTIVHRIMLHENLGEAHRKHVFQLMANELKMSHVVVSLVYMGLQLAVSFGFVWVCAALASYLDCSLIVVHWVYLIVAFVLLAIAYVAFKKKYYWMHEEYLANLKK